MNNQGVRMKSKNLFISLSILLIAGLTACSPAAAPATTNLAPAATNALDSSGQSNSAPLLSSPSLESLQQAYEKIYERVLPSVVNIVVVENTQSSASTLPFQLPNDSQPQQQQTALGSGFVWDTQGHIVTNNHVVEGAQSIMVTFADGSSKRASLVGTDVDSDLAVIKVDASSSLIPIQVTDSSKSKSVRLPLPSANQSVYRVSMTVGIISGLGRSLGVDSTTSGGVGFSIPDIIQTDTPISPGNSGGPLVDINGQINRRDHRH